MKGWSPAPLRMGDYDWTPDEEEGLHTWADIGIGGMTVFAANIVGGGFGLSANTKLLLGMGGSAAIALLSKRLNIALSGGIFAILVYFMEKR